MKILITAVSAALALCAQGQIALYKNVTSGTVTGAGMTSRRTVTGYTILELETGDLFRIDVSAALKRFTIADTSDFYTDVVRGSGTEYTVFSQATSYIDDNNFRHIDTCFIKGINSVLDIGDPHQRWRVPKTMQVIGRSLYFTSGLATAEEAAGTLTLDLKTTVFYNQAYFGPDDAVALLRANLLAQGYTEKK